MTHPIPPFFTNDADVLILGSFPSVKSREQGFFYGHPQNRFWSVLAHVLNCQVPLTIDDKKAFLAQNRIALWDVIAACDITGSSDSSIKNVQPNDISGILSKCDIKQIFVNGKTAQRYYNQYIKQAIGRDAICLPSTSAANAAWDVQRLVTAWGAIKL